MKPTKGRQVLRGRSRTLTRGKSQLAGRPETIPTEEQEVGGPLASGPEAERRLSERLRGHRTGAGWAEPKCVCLSLLPWI